MIFYIHRPFILINYSTFFGKEDLSLLFYLIIYVTSKMD